MKKILLIAILSLVGVMQACAVEQWKEGEHYVVLDKPLSTKPNVTEFFSYWCPHCASFEPLVAQMKKGLDKDVSFTKVHVNFMGFTSREVQDQATKAMLIARTLKRETELNGAIFNYIHKSRGTVANLNDLRNIFLVSGVEGEKFDKLAKGFSLNSLVKKNNKTIATYRSDFNSVPTFIVNGKYKAVFDRDRSMTSDDIVDLIVWLSKQK